MQKEWGGYLPLESTLEYNARKSLFDAIGEDHIIRLNSARNAVCLAVKSGGYKKVHIPLYMCLSVRESLDRNNIPYETYNIDEDTEPTLDCISGDEIIMICNFFGQKNPDFYSRCISKYQNVIFDNTQSLFMPPVMKENVYNVYSFRKFIGVPDGAALIGKDIDRNSDIYSALEHDGSYRRYEYLLKCVETSTNEAYKGHLASESELDEAKLMSPLTHRLLRSIDYEEVSGLRKRNFDIVKGSLEEYNELNPNTPDYAPMIYPLLVCKEGLRSRLVDDKFYVMQWWKWVIDDPRSNDSEIKLSRYLLPVPIDQRYSADDMKELCDLIIRHIRES